MKLRWKLLLVLLAVSVVPILFLRLTGQEALTRLQKDLSERARETISARTERELLLLARDHAEILAARGRVLELSVISLGEAVRQRLVGPKARTAPYRVSEMMRQSVGQGQPGDAHDMLSFRLPMMRGQGDFAEPMERLSGLAPLLGDLAEETGGLVTRAVITLPDGLLADWPALDRAPGMGRFLRESWYETMLENRRLTWSPPMLDPATGTPIRSVLLPLYDADDRLLAVVGLSAPIEKLMIDGSRRELSEQGLEAYLVRPGGEDARVFILASSEDRDLDDTMRHHWRIDSEPQYLTSSDEETFAALVQDLSDSRHGILTMPHDDELAVWSYAPTRRGLSLIFVVPLREAEQEALQAKTFVQERINQLGHRTEVVLAVVLLFIGGMTLWLSSRMSRAVGELVSALRGVARGDFSVRAPVRGRDELGDLARTFNSMVPALEDQVRMKESLGLASEVQRSLLPAAAPAVDGLDADGGSLYCDETGGDLYDFFPWREGSLCVVVGDVSGHGIPAALLMSSARAYLRARALTPGEPGELLTDVNRLLAGDTFGTGRFLTLALLVFDPAAGTVAHARAGHDPALIYDPVSDSFSELEGDGLPLGVLPEETYAAPVREGFAPGQVAVIGTDGIWETAHPQTGELYGKDRLKRIVRERAGDSSAAIRAAVLDDLARFRGDAPLTDDVTLVVVKAVG